MASSSVLSTPAPLAWHRRLFASASADHGMCAQTVFCFPCTASNVINKLETNVTRLEPSALASFVAGWCLTGGQYTCCASVSIRRALVQRYGIQGEPQAYSCVVGLCCAPCNYCQVQQEMAARQQHCGGLCAEPPSDAHSPSLSSRVHHATTQVLTFGMHTPRPWSSSLFACTPLEAVESVLCSCCVFGFVARRIDAERVLGVMPDGGMDPIACCCSGLHPAGWLFAARREVVERYNVIGESFLRSLCVVAFCSCCALTQLRREMGYSGEWPGGVIVRDFPRPRPKQPTAASTSSREPTHTNTSHHG